MRNTQCSLGKPGKPTAKGPVSLTNQSRDLKTHLSEISLLEPKYRNHGRWGLTFFVSRVLYMYYGGRLRLFHHWGQTNNTWQLTAIYNVKKSCCNNVTKNYQLCTPAASVIQWVFIVGSSRLILSTKPTTLFAGAHPVKTVMKEFVHPLFLLSCAPRPLTHFACHN
jgi:hypothetical protein